MIDSRELKGIPKLVKLLGSDVTDIQKNACGCLKNLSFGKENDNNKVDFRNAKGVFRCVFHELVVPVERPTHFLITFLERE